MNPAQRREAVKPQTEEQLRKILELERSRGCNDTAVVGGLDRFLRTALLGDGRALRPHVRAALRRTGARGYRSLTAAGRRAWLEETLRQIASPGPAPAVRTRQSAPDPAKATPAQTAARREAPAATEALDQPVTAVKGVSRALEPRLAKLGVRTVRDLLYYLPRRHNDYTDVVKIKDLQGGEEQVVRVRVWSAAEREIGRFRKGTVATVGDDTGMMRVVWFNQPYVARQLRPNAEVVLAGKVSYYQGQPTFDNPEWELWSDDLTHVGRLVPVYPLTEGLAGRTVRRVMRGAVDRYASLVPEALPADLRARHGFPGAAEAIRNAHFPETKDKLWRALRRLAFEELLSIQLAVLIRRQRFRNSAPAPSLSMPKEALHGFLASLPYALTGAQRRCLDAILSDMTGDRPMSRLLEGDVGSGKTVVATAALVAAVANGYQGAMMAPTEILAAQHLRTLRAVLNAHDGDGPMLTATPPYVGRPVRIAFLTGSLTAPARRRVREAVVAGEVDVAVGTHALIQEGVRFPKLGVVIVDEQHRFGVMQRAALREQGSAAAHMLVMTATPIPRTLALTLYGDLDLSVIDELPPGRTPVTTEWKPPDRRDEAYDFVRREVAKGRQAFIICPLVEESAAMQARAATAEFERLRRDVFPGLRLRLLHGRMSARDKDEAMRAFRDREADVLVSTAVVEVGVDVPNATVMLIEGADRFGLAQLHQFRGRVGRGSEASHCMLLADDPSEEARERLRLMARTSNGFELAEADLRLRGPGEFFGTRQAGVPGLRVAALTDVKAIERAREEAQRLLASDPALGRPEHAVLRAQALRMIDRTVDEVH